MLPIEKKQQTSNTQHRTTDSTALSWALDVRRSALGVRFDRVKFKTTSRFSVSVFQLFVSSILFQSSGVS
jgi:hypothetical protein